MEEMKLLKKIWDKLSDKEYRLAKEWRDHEFAVMSALMNFWVKAMGMQLGEAASLPEWKRVGEALNARTEFYEKHKEFYWIRCSKPKTTNQVKRG